MPVSTSSTSAYALGSPPGMMLGPSNAPSSPPDTPIPMKRIPLAAHSSVLRTVSGKYELPASRMMSPSSSSGVSSAMTSSTGLPALAITMIRRALQRVDEVLDGLAAGERALVAVVLHELGHLRRCAVVHGRRRPGAGDVAGQVGAHHRSPVTLIRLFPVGPVTPYLALSLVPRHADSGLYQLL
jgi:hypothetical protein